jgi:hypothetical protein
MRRYATVLSKSSLLRAKGLNAKDIYKEMFPVYGGKCLSSKAIHIWVANVSLMTKRLKRSCGSGWGNSQRTSVLRVSTRWDKCISVGGGCVEVRLSLALYFISICDLFTDSSSYVYITSQCKSDDCVPYHWMCKAVVIKKSSHLHWPL